MGDGIVPPEKRQTKCVKFLANGVTGILVPHSIDQVRELCNKVLWLDHGKQMDFGGTQEVWRPLRSVRPEEEVTWAENLYRHA